jgi:serine/threonine protein kinase
MTEKSESISETKKKYKNYVIIRKIGSGSQGSVYECKKIIKKGINEEKQTKHALKQISCETLGSILF